VTEGRTGVAAEGDAAPEALDWLCRTASCRFPLGIVQDGTLQLAVAGATVDRYGVATVRCPRCMRKKVWFPTRAPTSSLPGPPSSSTLSAR
jgi:hypothetical protein